MLCDVHQLADLQVNLNKYKYAPGFNAKSFKDHKKMLEQGAFDYPNIGSLDDAVENFQNYLRLVSIQIQCNNSLSTMLHLV